MPADSTLVTDHGIYFSQDGMHRKEELLNIAHKKQKLVPTELDDALAVWTPVSLDEEQVTGNDNISTLDATDSGDTVPGKRKTYESSCSQCGEFLQCKTCCVTGHARTPLHVIQEWNGKFWINITLLDLGLIYQLGHGGMRLMDLPLIHHVKYRYCKCSRSNNASNIQQCLRNKWYPTTMFRLQNVVGNINVHDFITEMEQQINATVSTGMDWITHRYNKFMRMSQQWAFLKRAKRARRAHDPAGLAGTQARECAVVCWACPHNKRNLPPDWRNVDKKYRFLYMLLVAQDTNFKLKNRMRANEHPDSPLGPGWGYFVELEKYREHLKAYTPKSDASTCIAFAALLQKDSRGTSGLRTSSVGRCVCARHECVLPNGIGDLQKGERYIIICWKRTLAIRNSEMPESIRLPLDKIQVQCALPVWHAGTHDEECETANSLSFKQGVGKSDGEGIEQTWAVLNPASYHTKDMSKGNRMDMLEDKIDSHNFLKNLGLGDALHRKLAVAHAEQERQVKAFKLVSETVEKDLRRQWQTQIDEWQKDSTKLNPYACFNGPSEAQECEAASGKTALHGTSATAFLTAGIQIEEAQQRIIADIGRRALVTPERESHIQELRLALLKKITVAEYVKLYMPHEPPEGNRARGCLTSLMEMEAKLRVAQCIAALLVMRAHLHAKRHLISFRNENVTGQISSTKARTLINQVGERVTASAQKYRKARAALVALKGEGIVPHFRELKANDIRLPGDHGDTDAAAQKKLTMISTGRGAERRSHDTTL
ncbi:hypothetical protein C8R45DRAFT_1057108 [Mycena sanguinolenta]|nr:hypothetical protein C8R45DRAFT_1057108 [Mycena sanguinolenta]